MAQPEPKLASETEWGRWLNEADAETRRAHPHFYWYVSVTDAPTKFFWDEQSVSREEYVANTGEDVRA